MKHKLLFSALFVAFFFLGNAQTKVTFYTSMGNFEAEMHDSLMPITAGNFLSLVDSNFYDGIIFHRVVSNFVIQGGDPMGTGFGGPGYTIPDEFDSTGALSNIKRTISMANSGPNTGGSQFFINLKNNVFLDYDKNPLSSAHPIFGIVRSGWNIVETIEQVPVDGDDKPITDVVMDSVRVTGSYLSQEEIKRALTKAAVYPNPIVSESVVDFYAQSQAVVKISITNELGQVISQNEVLPEIGKNRIPIAELLPSQQAAGIYILTLQMTTGSEHFKLIL